jgi:hypothetical protein
VGYPSSPLFTVDGVGTTSSGNATGSTFLIFCFDDGTSNAPSDSYGNNYVKVITESESFGEAQLWICETSNVGPGFTGTVGGFGGPVVTGWNGNASSPVDQTDSNSLSGVSSIRSSFGVNPSVNGELIIAFIGLSGTASGYSVDSGFTIAGFVDAVPGTSYGGCLAYLVQGTSAFVNPTFSWTGSANAAIVLASFEPGSSPPPPANVTLSAGVGAFAITGFAASFNTGLMASAGSMAITGDPASFAIGMNGGTGSLSITGQTASFDIVLSGLAGSFAITGFPASLVLAGNFSLNTQPGSFVITGFDADLIAGTSGGSGGSDAVIYHKKLYKHKTYQHSKTFELPVFEFGYQSEFHTEPETETPKPRTKSTTETAYEPTLRTRVKSFRKPALTFHAKSTLIPDEAIELAEISLALSLMD